jgi:hypothetical protein
MKSVTYVGDSSVFRSCYSTAFIGYFILPSFFISVIAVLLVQNNLLVFPHLQQLCISFSLFFLESERVYVSMYSMYPMLSLQYNYRSGIGNPGRR